MKDIPGFEEKYAVTEDGKIWSYKNKKFLKSKLVNGYPLVDLFKKDDNKKYPIHVHHCVAMTYIPNPYNLQEINHKDECKTNPHVSNLEWCTHKYNMNYGTRTQRAEAKKTKEWWDELHKKSAEAHKIPVLCIELGKVYESIKEAAHATGANTSHIGSCCRGKRRTSGGYHWSFVGEVKRYG